MKSRPRRRRGLGWDARQLLRTELRPVELLQRKDFLRATLADGFGNIVGKFLARFSDPAGLLYRLAPIPAIGLVERLPDARRIRLSQETGDTGRCRNRH